MYEFKAIHFKDREYDTLVIWLTTESFFDHIKKVEKHLSKTKKDKRVLIDWLFLTGNGQNRFMSILFSNGKFDYDTADNVEPDPFYREQTMKFLHDNYCFVEYSILTDDQRENIQEGIAF